jgi:hypothetical protein
VDGDECSSRVAPGPSALRGDGGSPPAFARESWPAQSGGHFSRTGLRSRMPARSSIGPCRVSQRPSGSSILTLSLRPRSWPAPWSRMHPGRAQLLSAWSSIPCERGANRREAPLLRGFLEWRDPDSNWGHHDFQSWHLMVRNTPHPVGEPRETGRTHLVRIHNSPEASRRVPPRTRRWQGGVSAEFPQSLPQSVRPPQESSNRFKPTFGIARLRLG